MRFSTSVFKFKMLEYDNLNLYPRIFINLLSGCGIVPSVRVKRKTGVNPYVFKNTDSAHDFLGKVSPPIT